MWLGWEYFKSIGKETFTKETILEGILNEEEIWKINMKNNKDK